MYDSPMTARQIKSAANAIFKMNQKGKKTMSNAQSEGTVRVNESPAAEAMRVAAEAAAAKVAEKAAKKAEKAAKAEKARAELKEIKAKVKAEKEAKKAVSAAAKPAKAPKVAGEAAAPKVRKPSASALFAELIMAGVLTDEQIFAQVQSVFGLSDDKKGYTKWYRNDLRKKGKNPPAAVVAVVAAETTEAAE